MEDETAQEQSKHFCKLVCLLIDIGGETLRDALLKELPQSQLAAVIQQKIVFLKGLKQKKVLTQPQFDILQEVPPDAAKFDISLLVALLRNLCPNIEPPKPNWKVQDPGPDDFSIGAELIRIRNIRNILLHQQNTLISKSTFTTHWNDLVGICLRIATKVSTESTVKLTRMIGALENRDVDPAGEKEKEILKALQDWKTQLFDILNEKISSLESSLDSLRLQNETVLNVVDAVRETGNDTTQRLESLQEQMTQIAENVSNITGDMSSTSSQAQEGMGDHVLTKNSGIREIAEQLKILKRDIECIKHHIQYQMNQQLNSVPGMMGDLSCQPVQYEGDLSDKEIDRLARKLGFDWEQLATFLDYEPGQKNALKEIYRDKPVQRSFQMIKCWRDVVVQCNESPKTLLAAAFANIQNYAVAQSLVPADQVDEIKDTEANQETKERVKMISFDRKGSYNVQRSSTPVMAVGGEGGINVFDGEITLGSLSIHPSTQSSTRSLSDLSSIQHGSNIQIGGSGSLNVFGGTVRTKDNEHVQIGQPSVPYNMNSNNCRGEGIDLPDGSASSAGANSFSDDSNFKKMIDNALPQAIMNKYNEIMKSVGALTVSNHLVGTVFRVGSKYVITAWHCVKFIVDPMNNGAMDWDNLQDPGVLVTFVYADVTKNPVNFSILNSIVTDELRNLDIAILELSDSSKLPQCLKLYTDEISYTRVPQVDIVGYGHPNSPNKHFDPSCNIVLPTDKVLQAAQAWLQQNKQRLFQTLKSNVDPALVDWGYTGYDRTDKIIFNFFLEHGSSGAPIFTTKCLGDPVVIGVVTNGLPNCFWDLTTTGQMLFPVQYRLEMGTRMSHIHSALRSSNPDLASELIL